MSTSSIERFGSGAEPPPNAATYLLAVLENPHGFVVALLFGLNTLVGELLKAYAITIAVQYLWPWLPTGVQRALLKVHALFGPRAKPRDRDHEIEELQARVQALEDLLGIPPARHDDVSEGSPKTSDGNRTES
jgi:hypothetical protein